MSRSLSGNWTRPLASTFAGAAVLASVAFAAPADAAFTSGKCLGDPIVVRGASFAASANTQVWIPSAFPVFCDGLTPPSIAYEPLGSGAGRLSMGARTGANADGSISRSQGVRLGASDEPLTTTVQAQINQGTDAVGDEALSRLIPVAIGAVAVVVNVPNGCSITTNPDGSDPAGMLAAKFSDPATANTRRLRLTRDQVEKAFNGGSELDTWGELVSNINDGNGTAGQAADTRCQSFPLVHVRRLDDGGTTFALKDYLNQLNPARGWATTFATPDTRTWPNATRTVAFDYNNDGDTADTVPFCAQQGGPVNGGAGYSPNAAVPTPCPETDVPLLQTTPDLPSAGNGNDNLVDQVNDLDGSIGYGDLSTVRQERSNAFERQANATDDRYWVQLQAKDLTSYADPSVPGGAASGGTRGSNCTGAALRDVPTGDDPTTGNWFLTSAVDPAGAGYGVCTLTYQIAFDDYSGPFSAQGDQAVEERRARTVKDYLGAVVSPSGQAFLTTFDYGPLPASVLGVARTAVDRIGWQKSGSSGGGGGTPVTPTPGTPAPGTPGPGTTPPPVVTPPTNQFTIPSARRSAGRIVLSVQVPGRGNLAAVGSAKSGRKRLSAGSTASSFASGGTVKLILKPSLAFTRALAKVKARKLTVAVKVTYTPTGGQAGVKTVNVTFKAPAKKKPAKKKSGKKGSSRS